MNPTRVDNIGAARPTPSLRRWTVAALLVVATATAPAVDVLFANGSSSSAADGEQITIASGTAVADVDGVTSH